MADPIRAALERLVKLDDAHEGDRQWEPWLNAVAAARAALDNPDEPAVPEGREPASVAGEPSDEELAELAELAELFNDDPVPAIRRALQLWGRSAPPTAPTAGEVGELVAWLRETGELIQPSHLAEHQRYKRTAALLEQFSAQAPQPVAVGERLPEPEDCDEEGRCWWGAPSLYDIPHSWRLCQPEDRFGSDLFWLPAHALPIPQEETQP